MRGNVLSAPIGGTGEADVVAQVIENADNLAGDFSVPSQNNPSGAH